MHRNLLRTLRIGVALAVLIAFVATFADFRNLLPAGFARGLASTQFGPSLVALILGAGLSAGVFLAVGFALVAGRVYCSALCPLGILGRPGESAPALADFGRGRKAAGFSHRSHSGSRNRAR